MDNFDTALELFLEAIHAKRNAEVKDTYPKFTAEKGVKRVRIVDNYCGRSAYCFVDKETGNILKAASWGAPAKGIRGNIYQDHGASFISRN